jgi:FkbM family methyltransferase
VTVRGVFSSFRASFRRDPDRFLGDLSGVIHVGANSGQERTLYEKHRLRVLWIEPIAEVFETLVENLRDFPRQRALQCLVTDADGAKYSFNVANNQGASSSLLDLDLHRDIWPEVHYERTITLRSTTLVSLLAREGIDARDYDGLVMDTQGSELMVLRGATPILPNFTYIKTEVPDFSSYVGCCQLADIEAFVGGRGFREHSRVKFAERAGGGAYYDVVYRNSARRAKR